MASICLGVKEAIICTNTHSFSVRAFKYYYAAEGLIDNTVKSLI